MIKLERSNLQAFCRTCLQRLEATSDTSPTYGIRETPNLMKLLILCTTLNINEDADEVFPQLLCTKCYQTLQEFQRFRDMALQSNEVLRELVVNEDGLLIAPSKANALQEKYTIEIKSEAPTDGELVDTFKAEETELTSSFYVYDIEEPITPNASSINTKNNSIETCDDENTASSDAQNRDAIFEEASTSAHAIKRKRVDGNDSEVQAKKSNKVMAERMCIQKLRELLRQETFRRVINDDGSVVAPKSAVFSELSAIIGNTNPLSAKNIYTILKLNRYQMHSFILHLYNIDYKKRVPMKSTLDNSSTETLSFTIDISTIWKDIEVEQVNYNVQKRGSRSICTLKRKTWTNFLFEEIFKSTKIKCPLTFKYNKLSETGYAVKVAGVCSECGCKFSGLVANKPVEHEAILMECQLDNYDASFIHKKKRQLKGSKRQEVGKELVEGKIIPSLWRRKEADKLMEYDDHEPPHLFGASTLRKVKQERQDHLLGIKTQIDFDVPLNLKCVPKSEGNP